MSVSEATVVGNLGADAEFKFLQSGTPVTSFTVCANQTRRVGGNPVEEQTWFTVNLYGNSAEGIAPYLTKGTLIYTKGDFRSEPWLSRDGKPNLTNYVNTNKVRILRSPKAAASAPEQSAEIPEGEGGDSDIPF